MLAYAVLDPSPPRRVVLATGVPQGAYSEFGLRYAELLEKHGWTFIGSGDGGTERWCRPGKSGSTSATLNWNGYGLLHVFSSSVAELESERSYSKLSFLTAVEFKGDFYAALQDLRMRGYGRTSATSPHLANQRRRAEQYRNSRYRK